MAWFSLAFRPLNTESSVPLLCFRAILFSLPPTLRAKIRASELAYYINPASFSRFDPRQNLSSARNALGKFFLETLFMQNLSLDGSG
jgi:hypothetical protein